MKRAKECCFCFQHCNTESKKIYYLDRKNNLKKKRKGAKRYQANTSRESHWTILKLDKIGTIGNEDVTILTCIFEEVWGLWNNKNAIVCGVTPLPKVYLVGVASLVSGWVSVQVLLLLTNMLLHDIIPLSQCQCSNSNYPVWWLPQTPCSFKGKTSSLPAGAKNHPVASEVLDRTSDLSLFLYSIDQSKSHGQLQSENSGKCLFLSEKTCKGTWIPWVWIEGGAKIWASNSMFHRTQGRKSN